MVLFSNRLDDDQKSRNASRLLTFPKPDNFKAEKPTPPILLEKNTSLEALVGEKSWTFSRFWGSEQIGWSWIQASGMKRAPSVK